MKTVYKYDLPMPGTSDDTFAITLPAGARPLTVRLQHGEPKLWAVVTPDNEPLPFTIRVAGTGHPLGPGGHAYLGTVQLGGGDLVFHYFSVDD